MLLRPFRSILLIALLHSRGASGSIVGCSSLLCYLSDFEPADAVWMCSELGVEQVRGVGVRRRVCCRIARSRPVADSELGYHRQSRVIQPKK